MKKHQHFIPRTYLKKFTSSIDKKSINAYNKKSEKYSFLSITNVCVEKNFYTLKNLKGEDRLSIENYFSEQIESKYPKVYKILVVEKKKNLSPDEKFDVLSVTLSMYFRTPKQLNTIVSLLDGFVQRVKDNKEARKINFFGVEIEIEDRDIKSLKKKVREKLRVDYLQIQLQLFEKFINFKLYNGLTLISNETDFDFFTGDNPVNFLNFDGISKELFNINNSTYIPLDAKHCLFIAPNKLESSGLSVFYQKDSFQLVHVVNSYTYENAELWLLGMEKRLNDAIEKVIEFNSNFDDEHPVLDEFKFKLELLQSLEVVMKKGLSSKNQKLIKKLKEIQEWENVEKHTELTDLLIQMKNFGIKF